MTIRAISAPESVSLFSRIDERKVYQCLSGGQTVGFDDEMARHTSGASRDLQNGLGSFGGRIQKWSGAQGAASRVHCASETRSQMTLSSQAIFPRSAASHERQRRE